MKVWKACGNMTKPVQVDCETPGYPNRDADGLTMYDNTHFMEESEAWEELRDERRARFSLSGECVKDNQRTLAESKERFVEASLLFAEFEANYGKRYPVE